jgi:hypothetical protein
MEEIDERAAADALMVTIRRIERMSGPWSAYTDTNAAMAQAAISQYGGRDALDAYLSLPSGHIEMRTVSIRGTPYAVIRAARGFEQQDDPYVVIIGPTGAK